MRACFYSKPTRRSAITRRWCEWTIREHATTLEAHKCRYKLAVLAMIQGDHADALKRFGQLADQADGPLAAEATAMRDFLKGKRLVENDAQPDR